MAQNGNKWSSKTFRDKRRVLGLCVDCNNKSETYRCEVCRAKMRSKKKAQQSRWSPEQKEHYRVRRHQHKRRQIKRRRDRRKEAGVCLACGGARDSRFLRCLPCRIKARGRRKRRIVVIPCDLCGIDTNAQHGRCITCRRGSRRKALQRLLEEQNYRCVYSGEALVLGVNAGIDHIVPRSRGGGNGVDNLQWVTRRLNSMKTDFTHDEFIEMCARVAERWQKKQNLLHIA